MNKKLKLLTILIFAFFAVALFVPKSSMQTKQIETAGQKFKNIKVLGEMPADQMGKVMNLMSASLGVDCNFCHIENNFAKDGNEHKDAAREMITMNLALNTTYFNNRPEISCNTCHNGKTHPQSAPNLMLSAKVETRAKQPEKKPTIEAILANYEAAIGGKENLAKITSRQIKAQRIEPDGKTFEPEEIWQNADKVLVTTKYDDYLVTEGFDGKTVWKSGNNSAIKLKADEGDQIKRNAQIFSFADLKTIYAEIDYRSTDKIDGREVYLVTAITADNQRERLYFDAQTGFLVRRVASTPTVLGNFQYQVDYNDYENFGGVKLPTTVRCAMPNISWTRKILEVKNNAAIDDAKFIK